jgi:hypothetical protein
MIAGAGAGNVKKMALGVVNVLKVGFIGDDLNSLLERNHIMGASHHRHCPEFQACGKAHGIDGPASNRHFNILGENFKAERVIVCRSFSTVQPSRVR